VIDEYFPRPVPHESRLNYWQVPGIRIKDLVFENVQESASRWTCFPGKRDCYQKADGYGGGVQKHRSFPEHYARIVFSDYLLACYFTPFQTKQKLNEQLRIKNDQIEQMNQFETKNITGENEPSLFIQLAQLYPIFYNRR